MRIGMIGGGQLARMLALAGIPMGFEFCCIEKTADCSASPVAEIIVGDYHDDACLSELSKIVDVITYESENITTAPLEKIVSSRPIYPTLRAVEIAQDRLLEKSFLKEQGIPCAPFIPVDAFEDLREALHILGVPALLKTRRFGYDGKGQVLINQINEVEQAWTKINEKPAILEQVVKFKEEVSLVVVRDKGGVCRFYALTHNVHHAGILRVSTAPYGERDLEEKAEKIATKLLLELDYVGVLAVEFFVMPDNELLVNEIAPRVHNSGHWTIEGAYTSQFENHIRAISGLFTGSTLPLGHCAMVNFIGELPDKQELLDRFPKLSYHDYQKAPRPRRKIGHGTLMSQDKQELEEMKNQFMEALKWQTIP